jgi:hypothetical protein
LKEPISTSPYSAYDLPQAEFGVTFGKRLLKFIVLDFDTLSSTISYNLRQFRKIANERDNSL